MADDSDANFPKLVSYAYENVIESAEEFTEIVSDESTALGSIIVVLFMGLMIVLVLAVIIAGIFKIIKG